jgi:hypothetical protein
VGSSVPPKFSTLGATIQPMGCGMRKRFREAKKLLRA